MIMHGFFVFVFLVVLALQFYIAYLFYEVAKDKGYDGARYFVIPLFFAGVGYLWIIALRDRKNEHIAAESKVNTAVVSDELPEL